MFKLYDVICDTSYPVTMHEIFLHHRVADMPFMIHRVLLHASEWAQHTWIHSYRKGHV